MCIFFIMNYITWKVQIFVLNINANISIINY